MPTSSVKKVLDRDFARVGATNVIDLICPLLRELVNHATHAFQRCQAVPEVATGLEEYIAPLALYRMVTECSNGIEELITESCSFGTVPLLRASFEAVISPEYINQRDSARRALSWLHMYIINRRRSYRLLKAGSPEGQSVSQAWASQSGATFQVPPDFDKAVAALAKATAQPHPLATRPHVRRLPEGVKLALPRF
jgi:hypothetical protein